MAATPAPDPLFFWNRAAAPARHHPAVFPASGSTFGVGAAPTASRTVADTVSGSHQYTLSGFALAQGLGVGARVCSDFFHVGNVRCRIEVFPSGCSPEHAGHLSVFVTSPDAYASGMLFLHEVGIVDPSGGNAHILAGRGQTSGPRPADAWGVVAAHPRICTTEEAVARLQYDSLTVRATVQSVRSWSHSVASVFPYAYAPYTFHNGTSVYAAAPPPPVVPLGAGLMPVYPA